MSVYLINSWLRRVDRRSCVFSVAWFSMVLALGTPPVSATLESAACADVIGTAADDDRVFKATGSGSLIAVAVDEPGFLAVQAEIDGEESAVAWVSLAPCRPQASKVGGFFDRGLLAIRDPGVVYLGVGLVDGSTPPVDLRLSTRLFSTERVPSKDGEDGDDTEEEEDEILPILWPGSDGSLPDAARGDLQGRFGKDGEDGDDTEEEEDEILPISTPDRPWVLDCEGGEPDDDLRLCAQPIERGFDIDGRLDANPYGRDLDYYTFTVASVEAVRIVAEGPHGLTGTLFDARGRSLAHRVADHDRFSFDLVLVPGRYYVRTEGWSGGDYRLMIEP